jgi:uncharacterized protein YhfF
MTDSIQKRKSIMTEKEMWKKFVEKYPEYTDMKYEAWQYGGSDPDALAELTASGAKTATASAYPCYEYEKEELPKEGELSLILKSDHSALCIIKTIHVSVIPFMQVSAEHAYKEGEGNRSLEFWRTVHRKFFTMDLAEDGLKFSEDMPVVCEEFKTVYPAEAE